MVKGDFWTDPTMKRWPILKRIFYQSLWAMAEDSCCVEDDPLGWKITAWSGPMDDDMSIEAMTQWRKELVRQHKLMPYKGSGTRCLYIPTMSEHERPRNPQPPTLPLPRWIVWLDEKSGAQRGRYLDTYTECSLSEHRASGDALSSPALPSPDLSGLGQVRSGLGQEPSGSDDCEPDRPAEGAGPAIPKEVREQVQKTLAHMTGRRA
jgi:hypothetical protein